MKKSLIQTKLICSPETEKRPKVDEAKTLSVVRLTMPTNGLTGGSSRVKERREGASGRKYNQIYTGKRKECREAKKATSGESENVERGPWPSLSQLSLAPPSLQDFIRV